MMTYLMLSLIQKLFFKIWSFVATVEKISAVLLSSSSLSETSLLKP